MRVLVRVLPLVLVAWYVWQTHAYLQVWRLDLTLWAHAATMAPHKPRVLMNFGRVLIRAGHPSEGATVMLRAYDAAQAPHVPEWDRQRAEGYVVIRGRP